MSAWIVAWMEASVIVEPAVSGRVIDAPAVGSAAADAVAGLRQGVHVGPAGDVRSGTC